MEVLVKGLHDVILFIPESKTYGIRIMNSGKNGNLIEDLFKNNNDKYFYVARYVFDDMEPGFGDGVMFDDIMARKVITEFKDNGLDKAECLVVNCTKGQNRSPAIALALNEIFSLNGKISWEDYPGMNMYVYKLMKDVATRDLKLR